MSIVFTGQTANDYWRWIARSSSTPATPTRHLKISTKVPSTVELMEACRLFAADDSNIDVATAGSSLNRKTVKTHHMEASLPDYSLCKIESGVYVVSPELLFVLAARKLDLIALIRLGFELTAKFTLSDGMFDDGVIKCQPITTLQNLRKYTSRADGLYGIKKARMAARHVLPNAASPREIDLMMMLTLPVRLGGYGLPKPLLNMEDFATKQQLEAFNRMGITPDACWPEHRLVLEYDSDAHHTGAAKIARDSRRRNDIMRLGYDVITVTNDEYNNAISLDNIYEVIRKRLGLRRRYPDAVKHHVLKGELMRLRDLPAQL